MKHAIYLLMLLATTASAQPLTLLGVDSTQPRSNVDTDRRPATSIGALRSNVTSWTVVEEGAYLAPAEGSPRFDPVRDTPSFSNSITVNWHVRSRPDEEWQARSYSEGCCSGMCAMAHIWFREFTNARSMRTELEEPFRRSFFWREPLPAAGSAQRHLRDYCESHPQGQAWAGSFSGSAQPGATPWSSRGADYLDTAGSASAMVDAITADIRARGTSRVSITWLKPSDRSSTGSHAILAYAVREGTIACGTGADAPRRLAKIIYLWDPNILMSQGGVDPKTITLFYIPALDRLTFSSEYHGRKNPPAENPETHGVMQLGEFATADTDTWVTRMTTESIRDVLRTAAEANFNVTFRGRTSAVR